MNLQNLFNLLTQLKNLEQQVIECKNDAKDVENRSKDLTVLYRDVVKQVQKDVYNEMVSKVAVK